MEYKRVVTNRWPEYLETRTTTYNQSITECVNKRLTFLMPLSDVKTVKEGFKASLNFRRLLGVGFTPSVAERRKNLK